MKHVMWAAALCLSAGALPAANTIKVESVSAAAGQTEVLVRILADNDAPLQGISFAGTYDSRLTFVRIELGAAIAAAEKFVPVSGATYFGAAMILEFGEPWDFTDLPPGENQVVFDVYFNVAAGVPGGTSLPIDLRADLGSPIIDPVFTVDGNTVTPALVDGAITVVAAPIVTAVTPKWGAVAGGAAVTVAGQGFTADTAVTFGGAALENLVFVNAATITGNAPAHAAGAVTVVATNTIGTGSLDNAFTYVEAPAIASVAPDSGPGDAVVTITGTNFTDSTDTTVLCGGLPATQVNVLGATQLTCRVPACGGETGARDIQVATAGGSAVLADAYTCTAGSTFRRGDANCDSKHDIADAIAILSYLFSSKPAKCLDALNANDSDKVDIADAIYLLGYLFASGPPPPPPFESLGVDETPIGCEEQCGA
ncbi:MAG TPA: hypothetical protein DCM87_09290 [Planctomycetes bacterium]|nr:hypothetical protein [Planctomycetota bacterium]